MKGRVQLPVELLGGNMVEVSRNDLLDMIIRDLIEYQKINPNAQLNTAGFIVMLQQYKN